MDTYVDKHLCIFVVLLLGLYFYSYHGQKVLENFSIDQDCPDILIQQGSKIYLRNTKLADIPGVNPIAFDNLEP